MGTARMDKTPEILNCGQIEIIPSFKYLCSMVCPANESLEEIRSLRRDFQFGMSFFNQKNPEPERSFTSQSDLSMYG